MLFLLLVYEFFFILLIILFLLKVSVRDDYIGYFIYEEILYDIIIFRKRMWKVNIFLNFCVLFYFYI